MRYKNKLLGEIIQLKRGYDLPKSDRRIGKYPVISSSGINGYHSHSKVIGPGVITGRSGQLGKVYFSEIDFWPLNTTLYVEDFKGNDPLYVYYFLKTLNLSIYNSGSSVPTLNRNHIHSLEVKIPELRDQKKISYCLRILDSKIELNNQIINTLEETATTLFNHWFIDFEFPNKNGNPYKSSGGKMIESELGEIPEGWEVSSLKNITEIIMGQSPKGTSYNNEDMGLPLINGASDFKNGFVNPKKYTTEPKKVTKQADIIFGVRATIGNPTIVQQEYAIGRGAGIARVIDNHYQEFVFLLLKEMFKYFANTGSGSVYINISKNDFESYKFVHPSLELILKFHESVMSIFELIANKRSEIESLKELRDTLLPKLLSGEIELE